MTWHKANFVFQVNYPPDTVKTKVHSDGHLYQLHSRFNYISQIQSIWTFILKTLGYPPNGGIFKPISDSYCKYNKYYQIQPNIQFILIQLNIWLLQLRYDLTYDPFWPSNPQILPSVRYIPECSLAYDYPFIPRSAWWTTHSAIPIRSNVRPIWIFNSDTI